MKYKIVLKHSGWHWEVAKSRIKRDSKGHVRKDYRGRNMGQKWNGGHPLGELLVLIGKKEVLVA